MLVYIKFINKGNCHPLLVKPKGPCDRSRDTGTPSGRKRKIAELSSYDT